MATSEPMEQRITAMARMLAEEFGEVDESNGDCWLDAVENRAVEIGDALTAELLKQTAERRPLQEEAVCPGCGKLGQYKGHRERALIGRRGPVAIREVEYFCPCCRKAFFPADPRDRG